MNTTNKSISPLEASVDIENIPILSRDQFLEMIKSFQACLFREDITKKTFSDSIATLKNFLKPDDVTYALHFISTIRYREHGDIETALKYYYQVANKLSVSLIYILKKESGNVSLSLGCYGVCDTNEKRIRLENASKVVSTTLPGFLPGLKSQQRPKEDLMQELKKLNKSYRYGRVVFGVPCDTDQNLKKKSKEKNEDKENKSLSDAEFGIERVIDAIKDDFVIMGYSEPVSNESIYENQRIFGEVHDLFHFLSKQTEQISRSLSEGQSFSSSKGVTHTRTGAGGSETVTEVEKHGAIIRTLLRSFKSGKHPTIQKTTTKPTESHAKQITDTEGWNKSSTDQKGFTYERTNELSRQTEALLSRQMRRLEKGLASGMWRHTTQVFATQSIVAEQVANVLCGYWGGGDATLAQMKNIKIEDDLPENLLRSMLGIMDIKCIDNPLGDDLSGISTLLTSEELAKVASLPFHEIPGIVVERLTDYGRNYTLPSEKSQIKIGNIIDHEVETEQEIKIGFEQIKRHMFVTGATGAGKSTTMRQILVNLSIKNIPFLVIEPVKREYRELKQFIPNLQVVTLGTEDCAMSLNPFDVEPKLGLIPHIDNLKAAFNATMGNYSSMPFILEDMIYRAYEECGWDLVKGENVLIDKLKSTGFVANTTPRMRDLLPLVESSIKKFFPSQSDYGNSLLGALRARISSMTRGSKGKVIDNNNHALSMKTLLEKPCVIELWPFTDNEEKAFIMALLMIKLYEYRQSVDIQNVENKGKDLALEHVLVIEEAHRLLSKPQFGGEHSSNGRQKAIEFFADILAEIRSYGQGIVIVDQIPSKLIPDVLKNTDVKIAHRLTDKEDRDILGGTMNLTQEQIKDIAKLDPGEGIVYYGGLRQAMKIKVPRVNAIEKELEKKNERRFFDD